MMQCAVIFEALHYLAVYVCVICAYALYITRETPGTKATRQQFCATDLLLLEENSQTLIIEFRQISDLGWQ